MTASTLKPTKPSAPVRGFFEGERLELNWRFAYRPEFRPLLLDYLGAQSGMHILDVGCGSGFLSRLLARELDNVQVVGLDADEAMLTLAQEMLDRENLSGMVELRNGDAFQLPFRDETFDLVTSQTLVCVLGDPARGLHEQMRVARPGGTVSAIVCFCHSGGLPHYHGRYPLPGNHRIDELDLKLDRVWRYAVRPNQLGVDHSILNMDFAWQFREVGLQEVQINGSLALISPGDSRIPPGEGAAYALARQQIELDGLIRMQSNHGDQLAQDGFSQAEFDELITLKRTRLSFLQDDPARIRDVMEVFSEPVIIVRGTKAVQS